MQKKEINDENDVSVLILALWHHKIIFIILFVLSIFYSMYVIKNSDPEYSASAVVEITNKEKNELNIGDISSNLLSRFVDSDNLKGSDNFVARIMGREFLASLLQKSFVDEEISASCNYSTPRFYSPRGILDYLSIYKIKTPSEEQIKDFRINCLNSLISVNKFIYGKIETGAFVITVQHTDPFFAAQLANLIVEEYFVLEREEKRENFKNTLVYLSKSMASSQVELDKARRNMELFVLEHPQLAQSMQTGKLRDIVQGEFQISSKETGLRLIEIAGMEKQYASIIELEKKLELILQKNNYDFKEILSAFEKQENISNVFLTDFQEVIRLNISTENKNRRIKNLISRELDKLKDYKEKIDQKIKDKEFEAKEKLMLIEKLNTLTLAYATKKFYLESLSQTMQSVNIDLGKVELFYNIVHSKAIPPLIPSSPNIKAIFLINGMVSLFLASFFIFVRQLIYQNIYSLSQLNGQIDVGNRLKLSFKKDLVLEKIFNSKHSGDFGLDLNFLDSLLKQGKIGCFIDVTKKGFFTKNFSETVSLLFANIVNRNNSTVVHVSRKDADPKSFLIFGKDKAYADLTSMKGQLEENNRVVLVRDHEALVANSKFFPLREEFKKFERVFVSADNDDDNMVKYDLLKNCDFFVLTGQAGNFSYGDVFEYFKNENIKKEKCLGFILIGS